VELRDKVGKWVDENWDHAFLVNDQDEELLRALNSLKEKRIFVFRNENPTAEVMAKHLYDYVRKLYGDLVSKVRIWESPNQYAEYFKR
jgi:6-pyruvoyltetrahydropterin/6-carboxytetrahydropterin synthase